MNKDKWIFQTFWTKPMSKDKIETNVQIAYISCYYLHKNGYKVRMYTDKYGKELLINIKYDEINTKLDSIPDNIPNYLFAYAKFWALKNEPIGTIHTDFDVFIKKPCIDEFYNKNYDLILQNKELNQDYNYKKLRNVFNKIKLPNFLPVNHIGSCNVGVIGFNNKELKNKYLDIYFKSVEYYKDYLNSIENINILVPDLLFEQTTIDWLKDCYNTYFILPELNYGQELNKICNNIGYQHLLGAWKHTEEGKLIINNFYNKIKQL